MISKKDDYNNVPVKYCVSCIELKILLLNSNKQAGYNSKDIEYCGKCGSTEINECHIEEHDKKYRDLYGKSYLTRNK